MAGIETTMGLSGGSTPATSRMGEYASAWVLGRGVCTSAILRWP